MLMGRPKVNDKSLPQRMRRKGDSYYHVANQKWTPLGKDLHIAKVKWAELEGMPTDKTVSVAIDKYFASKEFAALAENTRRSYTTQAKTVNKYFGRFLCSSIRPAHIHQFKDINLSNGVINVCLNVLKKALDKAVIYEWIHSNPCVNMPRNATKSRGRYLTDDEYSAIMQHAPDSLRAIMKVAYLTGQRQIDVIKMRLSDITDEGINIIQKKTGHKQMFTWTDELREAIADARALKPSVRGMTLFCTRTGQQYSASNLRKQWKTACDKAGIEDAQFRDLRSKSATDAAELDQDYQAILGHTTRAMSDRYVKKYKVEKVEPLRKKI